MTDPVDSAAGSFASSRPPKRARATVAELTRIVRPPGNPSAVQAFTTAEASEAQRYADAMGAQVEPLAAIKRDIQTCLDKVTTVSVGWADIAALPSIERAVVLPQLGAPAATARTL